MVKELMGLIADAATMLQNAIGDLFPEEQPSSIPAFPSTISNPTTEPTITIRKSTQTPSIPSNPEPIGKITSYNYQAEELPDTNSKMGLGAWDNRLTNEGIAVSPDIEQMFKKAGIKPLDRVRFDLQNGKTIEGVWQDRTMQDKQAIKEFGKPLRGRIDLNVPHLKGRHPLDGTQVTGFSKIKNSE